jgi:O-antigen ligase
MVIGVCYIFAADRVLRERKSRLPNIVAAGLCLAFIVMTKSRGPLLAVVAATVVLTYGYSRRLGLATAGIILAVVAAVIVAATLHLTMVTDIFHQILDRGTSYRLDIWSFTLTRVGERPLFGHGLAAYLGMSSFFTFPHNIFLSALFYTGIVGLTLLLLLVISITIHLIPAWHRPGTPLLFALWVNVLCGGLTDIGQLTTGPSPVWFFFWLPLGLICTHLTATEKGAHKSARPENGDTGTLAPG